MLTLDNDGWTGAITPFAASNPMGVVISGGARGMPAVPGDLLRSLHIGAGGLLTLPSAVPPAPLELAILGDARIEAGASLDLDGCGYMPPFGHGAGLTAANAGSGAGHGGFGGATLQAPGRVICGSAEQPVDFRSGGGLG